jgi:hypothetical protein
LAFLLRNSAVWQSGWYAHCLELARYSKFSKSAKSW